MDLICKKLVGSSQSVLVGVDLLVMFLANCARLWLHHVVVVNVVVLISSRVVASRLRTRSLILLVHAAASWAARALVALAATAEVARVSVSVSSIPIVVALVVSVVSIVAHVVSIAGALATRNDQLHCFLLRIEVRIQKLSQLLLIFFWKRFQLLDLSSDGFALTFIPKLLQRFVVMRGFSQQATECDSAATKS